MATVDACKRAKAVLDPRAEGEIKLDNDPEAPTRWVGRRRGRGRWVEGQGDGEGEG